ncbi:MAG: hypothetical protein LQ338_002145 [Usnochroma carphineum]|nr:MAG: hypothetical protein LQ338_002145 [Usnochroma carphineum]
MPSAARATTPGLATFLSSIRGSPVEYSIDQLISFLKRRQIRNSQPCAIATAHLLRRVVGACRVTDVAKLIERVQQVGQRLVAAQPKELSVGNIVRRVLGVIRDEAEENRKSETGPYNETATGSRPEPPDPKSKDQSESGPSRGTGLLPSAAPNGRPPLLTSNASYVAGTNAPITTSLFSLLSHPPSKAPSPSGTPGTQSPGRQSPSTIPAKPTLQDAQDLRAEVMEGIQEIIDELKQVDDQIAGYAPDHIHSNAIILTHTPSMTVQKFFLKAAAKRKFTVVYAETSPVDHLASPPANARSTTENHDEVSSRGFQKALTVAGITVVVVPFSAVFALMSRVTKVVLDTHVVLADGGLVAAAGAKAIAKAASVHRTPVVVLSGVYKLSPVYPFDTEALIEFGEPSKVIAFGDGHLVGKVGVENPLFDFVAPELVDLYITNLGGHAPSYLYRIAADHYRSEDMHLTKSEVS